MPDIGGIMIRGSAINSDFCATVPFIKNRLQMVLLNQQAKGDENNWTGENAFVG